MKALGLLLLRSGFSFLVAVWAAARIVSPEGGIPLLAVWLPGVQPDAEQTGTAARGTRYFRALDQRSR